MQIQVLTPQDLPAVMDLFCVAFREDAYYARLFPEERSREREMRNAFSGSIAFCVDQGYSVGVYGEGDRLIAFLIGFDYKNSQIKEERQFWKLFSGYAATDAELPYSEKLHARVNAMEGDVLYLLSIAVSPEWQRRGLASALVEHMLRRYPDYSFAGDVSNKNSLGMYRKRRFDIQEIEPNYFLVSHDKTTPIDTAVFGDEVKLLLPSAEALNRLGIGGSVEMKPVFLPDTKKAADCGFDCFLSEESSLCPAFRVTVPYKSLLCFQRAINLAQNRECFYGDAVYYISLCPYEAAPLLNDKLEEMIASRKSEWAVIPDIFVSTPMQYRDIELLAPEACLEDPKPQQLLNEMDFRAQYEAGIPSDDSDVDDLSNLKTRVKRLYLGKVKVQIAGEPEANAAKDPGETIGPAAYIDLYVSVDRESDCAVLTWYSQSSPFLLSQLLDNVIRNNLQVVEAQKVSNFFDYISARFSLFKRGTPKAFLLIPERRECLQDNQLASLLAAETIYPDGENFGKIIDTDILKIVGSPNGLGQYNRATILAYTNVVLQFSPELACSTIERLDEASITLYYMELILMEEAAIQIADHSIVKLLSKSEVSEPVAFLKRVDQIYDNYCKTIIFWNIQVNYPTSQKSIDMLRNAFRIDDQLVFLHRNQAQLQTIFDIKCDIIDRRDSRRMDVSLAIISILAVFSAWMDGHDYIATWSDVLSSGMIHFLQRVLFALILITAIYVIVHMTSKKARAQYQKQAADRKSRVIRREHREEQKKS